MENEQEQEQQQGQAADVRPAFDPGLTQRYTGVLKRVINPDGQFNVRRTGQGLRDWHPYLFMISTPWPTFFLLVVAYVSGAKLPCSPWPTAPSALKT